MRLYTYLIGDDVKEAGAALAAGGISLANEVLLGMTGNLSGSTGDDKVAGYSPPVTLAQLLQT